MKIEDGDRRYNIAPRQEVKLEDAHPEVIEQIDDIYKELHDFAGILKTYEVNTRLVRTCVNNDAKTEMRHVSMSVFEEFCQALKQGKLEYFSDVLQIETTNVMGGGDVLPAQRFVKGWIARVTRLHNDQRRTLACCVPRIDRTNPSPQRKEFAKRLDRNGLTKTRKRQAGADRDSNPIRGIEVEWDISMITKRTNRYLFYRQRQTASCISFVVPSVLLWLYLSQMNLTQDIRPDIESLTAKPDKRG